MSANDTVMRARKAAKEEKMRLLEIEMQARLVATKETVKGA